MKPPVGVDEDDFEMYPDDPYDDGEEDWDTPGDMVGDD